VTKFVLGRVMKPEDPKKKPYFPPALKEITREQAIKLVMERKNCSEEEAARFVDSLKEEMQNDDTDQERKRSA
jgi:hypothetical protein